MSTDHHAGLEDIEVLESSICEITQNTLNFRGYAVTELAAVSTFEEVAYLLWNDALPSQKELGDFIQALRSEYSLPREIVERLEAVDDHDGRPHRAELIDRSAVARVQDVFSLCRAVREARGVLQSIALCDPQRLVSGRHRKVVDLFLLKAQKVFSRPPHDAASNEHR